ncbi:MAG: TonB-dependent receptor [Bacteroidota bacterium]|nr:TonB-dependent receptor [Bacteroidota bacterium]
MLKPVVILSCLLLFLPIIMLPDEADKRFTISGFIKDSETGEDLIGVTIYIKELQTGTATNTYGFYSLNLLPGTYTITYSYVGYQAQERKIELQKDIVENIELIPSEQMLKEVQVVAKRPGENIKKAEMSVVKMDAKQIRSVPTVFGETDILKVLQLLPGVSAAAEGSTGFSVRGGSIDQNLILLDEATVYNAGHMLGFFSVFNNDAVKDMTLYKGEIPAKYGGRLSSVLDVRMKDGNNKRFSGTGGIGLISSRLTLEGPIIKNKTSFLVSGRRTYMDIFLPIFAKEDVRDSKLYFYDLNAKVNHIFNENNRLYISGYFGRDVFKNQFARMNLGNQTATVRWNHLFSKKIFSNFTFVYSKYKYSLGTANEDDANSFTWDSYLEDFGLKGDFTWYLDANNTFRYGISLTHHTFNPGVARGGENSLFTEYIVPKNHSIESSLYASNEQKIGALWVLKYGLRFSLFNNIGPGTVYYYDENYEQTHVEEYGKGKIYNTYWGLEPRVAANYILNEISSIKASYARTYQYVQLAQNSTAGTPLDLWFSASPNVKPQIADQVAAGYFRNFLDNTIETSVEVYYKNMQNTIDFKDHAELLLNKELEGELRIGKSWSYGIELLVRVYDLKMAKGKISGWVGYTYSRAWRKIPEINNGDKYPSPYDRPHDLSIVLTYDISRRVSASANWVYQTGVPVTMPTGRAIIGGNIVPIYSDRNGFRYDDYHRLDVSLTLRGKDKPRRFKHEWVFSVYNAYNRHNTWAINFEQEVSNSNQPTYEVYATRTYLYSIIPSVTFNFKF